MFNEFDLFATNMQHYTKGPLNTFSGGMGSFTIDYIAIPSCLASLVIECEVVPDEILNTSDHFVVRTTLDIKCDSQPDDKDVHCPRVKWSNLKADVVQCRYTIPVNKYVSDKMDTIEWENVTENM